MIKKQKIKLYAAVAAAVLVCLAAVVIIILLSGDKLQRNNKNLLVKSQNSYSSTEEMIKEILSYENNVPEVSTKYSILYKSGNNRNSYIFANPVRKLIDNEYKYCDIAIDKTPYGFEIYNANYNSQFCMDKIKLTQSDDLPIILSMNGSLDSSLSDDYINIYGEAKKSVRYSDDANNLLYVTPTYSGLLFEYNLTSPVSQVKYKIDIGALEYENEDAGYVMLEQNEAEKAIIHRPVLFDDKGKIHILKEVQIKKENKELYLVIEIPSDIKVSRVAFNLDFYTEKMFFDTSAYQSALGTNSLFSNISIFDSSKDNGGYTYMKFNLRSYTPQNAKLVDSVLLNMYALCVEGETTIEVYKVPGDWCSWTLSWKNKPDFKKQIGEFTITESGWYSIDLTDYVKELIDDNYDNLIDNSIVFKIKDETSGYAVFASTDNTYAPPYFDIKYRVK